jgi:hypothetical protein
VSVQYTIVSRFSAVVCTAQPQCSEDADCAMPPVARHTSEPKPSALMVHRQCDRSVQFCCGIEYHRPLPLCTYESYMHTSSHASTHERAHDGTQTQARKQAVPENVSELGNSNNAEVRATCICGAMRWNMRHATRSDRDGTCVCRPASTWSSRSRGRAVVQTGLQHGHQVGSYRRSPTTQCQS